MDIKNEISRFQAQKRREASESGQRATLQLCCGIALEDLQTDDVAQISQIAGKIERALKRERRRATTAHWSYDLNRHLALKQAYDRIRDAQAASITTAIHRRQQVFARQILPRT